MPSLEPLPESIEAADELDPVADDGDLLPALVALAAEARDVVPELVAVSVSRIRENLTFTLVDASEASLTGPTPQQPVERAGSGASERTRAGPDDALDEGQWRSLAQKSAVRAIRSTLTLPVVVAGDVVETVSLYATSEAAFEGHHGQMAMVFGAWAPGAVTNADLSFTSREEALQAPRRVRERIIIDVAIGVLAARLDVDVGEAERRLETASVYGGVELLALARAIVRMHGQR